MAIEYASIFLKFFGVNSPPGDYAGGGVAEVLVDQRLGNGTSALQGNKIYHDTRTLALSSNEDIDFQTILDANAVAIALVDVVILVIEMAAANGDEFQVAPASSNGWTALISGTSPVLHCPAGCVYAFYIPTDPGLVVSGSNLALNFANQDSGASGDYTLTILGRDA